MLRVDLAGSSDEELATTVAGRCSAFGPVNRVTIYAARAGTPARPFAIVAMGTRQGAETVSATFGGRTVGNAVVVFLAPEVAVMPSAEQDRRPTPDNVVALGKAGRHQVH